MTQHATSATAAIRYLHALFDYLRLRGVTDDALLQGKTLDLNQPEARISELEAAELFTLAATLLNDDALGLHVGEMIRPGHYGALGHVAMACGTLGEALLCQQRYQGLVLSIPALELKAGQHETSLSWKTSTDARYRQLAEFNLAGLLSFVRWITGRPLMPLQLDLTYASPADTTEHQRVFGCPLRFEQACYRLVVPTAWQALPLIQPNPAMRQMMDRLAARQLAALRQGDDLVTRARGLIARQLSEGTVELAALAKQLNVSARSFQRLLQEQELSFTQLVDEVRRELAESYLAEPNFDLTDIAFLLGFSEQSAFQRAFKRWTGKTPAAFRAGS